MADTTDQGANPNGTHQNTHNKQRSPYDYGGNPLARADTSNTAMLPAFGGEFRPGLYKQSKSNIANPAPLGLSAFALTTFLLSLINIGARGTETPSIVIAAAFGYGGLVQLLAGMWEMAVGNTFGATALSSYGGFWISFAIILTPGGFAIESHYEEVATTAGAVGTTASLQEFYNVFGFYLFGWFIFTFVLLMCTLRSTVAFFFLFFTLDLAFLMLAIGYLNRVDGSPNPSLIKAGGYFGIFSAFAAWYNALAGILDRSNSFFLVPVAHFPWSEKGRERRGQDTMVQAYEKRSNDDAKQA